MRSKVATEEILARTGKLSEIEYKNVWKKHDMNEDEREKPRKK